MKLTYYLTLADFDDELGFSKVSSQMSKGKVKTSLQWRSTFIATFIPPCNVCIEQILCLCLFAFWEWYNFVSGFGQADLHIIPGCHVLPATGVGGTAALSSCLNSVVPAPRHDQFTEDIVGRCSCWLNLLLAILCLWTIIFHELLMWTVACYELLIWTIICNELLIWTIICNELLIWTIICNELLIWTVICNELLIWTVICNKLLIWTIICDELLIWTIICNELLIWTIICNELLMWTVICNELLMWTVICNELLIWTIICNELLIWTVICNELLIWTDICVNWHLIIIACDYKYIYYMALWERLLLQKLPILVISAWPVA